HPLGCDEEALFDVDRRYGWPCRARGEPAACRHNRCVETNPRDIEPDPVMNNSISLDEVRVATLDLLNYCKSNDWAGYDHYDALNSRVLEALPFLNSRIPRLALTQALKRSPINIR